MSYRTPVTVYLIWEDGETLLEENGEGTAVHKLVPIHADRIGGTDGDYLLRTRIQEAKYRTVLSRADAFETPEETFQAWRNKATRKKDALLIELKRVEAMLAVTQDDLQLGVRLPTNTLSRLRNMQK